MKNVSKIDFNLSFATNLEKERIHLGQTQAEFAKNLELSLSSYKRLIYGETTKIEPYTAHLIYKLTGKLPFQMANSSDPYLDIIGKILQLPQENLNFLNAIIDFQEALKPNYSSSSDPSDKLMVFVPTNDMHDGMIFDSTSFEWVNAGPYRKRYGSALHCGIKITSNHLHPVYFKNDILLISRNPVRDGDTGIFIHKDTGCCYLRKFHQTIPCTLEPLNGYGETFYVDSDDPKDMEKWVKFGFVLSKMR